MNTLLDFEVLRGHVSLKVIKSVFFFVYEQRCFKNKQKKMMKNFSKRDPRNCGKKEKMKNCSRFLACLKMISADWKLMKMMIGWTVKLNDNPGNLQENFLNFRIDVNIDSISCFSGSKQDQIKKVAQNWVITHSSLFAASYWNKKHLYSSRKETRVSKNKTSFNR